MSYLFTPTVQVMGQVPPCSSLAYTNALFNLLFYLSPSRAMLIKSTLFSLTFWGNTTFSASLLSVRMEPHLSVVQTDWITVLQEHTMLPLPAIFCILIESILSLSSPCYKGGSHLLHQCAVEAQQKTTPCCIPSAQRDSYSMVAEEQ